MAKTVTASAVAKAAEKTAKAMEKALAAEEAKPVGKATKGKGKAAAGATDTDKPVKRTRAPSDFNKYMKVRLAEMKEDPAIMAEFPGHRDRFSNAANEWKTKTANMTKEEKTAFVADLIAKHGGEDSTETQPSAPAVAKPKASAKPKAVPAPKPPTPPVSEDDAASDAEVEEASEAESDAE